MSPLRRSLLVAAAVLAACRSSSSTPGADPGLAAPSYAELGLPVAAFVESGTGTRRGELAGDCTVPLDGCVSQVVNGTTPNQAGAWWYGRGGWCPGQQVTPQIVDVTADVVAGATATIGYRGLYAGAPPPDGSGTIDLTSWLVVYE